MIRRAHTLTVWFAPLQPGSAKVIMTYAFVVPARSRAVSAIPRWTECMMELVTVRYREAVKAKACRSEQRTICAARM